MKKVLVIAVICTLIDQVIKNVLFWLLSFGSSVEVISNFFSLTMIQNTGAAFSILSSNTLFLIVVSLISLCLIYYFFIKGRDLVKVEEYLYGILIGGILGNLIDRIVRGYVIDYLDFNVFGYNFPVFNLADVCIMVSIALIVIHLVKGEKNEVSSK